MQSIPQERVRAWRAARHHFSEPAARLEEALGAEHSFAHGSTTHVALCARLEGYDPRHFRAAMGRGGGWTLYSDSTLETRLLPSALIPALLACDAFRRESRLSRRKAFAQREEWVRRWGPPVLALLDDRPESASAIGRRLGVEALRQPDAQQLEVTLHALVGRGNLCMASSPSKGARVQANRGPDAYVFWRPADSDRVEPSPRDGWGFLGDLALHYFGTAGPATRDDFAWWLNISLAAARRTIEDLSGTLEEVDLAGSRRAHFMLEEDAIALRSRNIEPSRRVALVPRLDPEALWSREGFLRVFDPAVGFWISTHGKAERGGRPRIALPALIGGDLAGGWRFDARAGEVVVEFLEAQPAEVEEEAQRLGKRLARLLDDELPALFAGGNPNHEGRLPPP